MIEHVSSLMNKYLICKPGFHTVVSDVMAVSDAELFVERFRRLYGDSLAIVSNDPCVEKVSQSSR